MGDSSWQDRLRQERVELYEKLTALEAFQYSPAHAQLAEHDRLLLTQQHHAMKWYLEVLDLRIARIS